MMVVTNDSIRVLSVIVLLTAMLLSGCTDHPVTRLHILTTIQNEPDQLKKSTVIIKNVGIREIKLPAYLDRPQIVSRVGDNELVLSSSHQWGEPLSQSVSRVLAEQLDNELVNARVFVHPWSHKQTITAQIEVQINQFEIVDTQACVLDVSWLIWPKDNNTAISHHAMITVPVNNQQYSTLVNAHSQAIVQLSKQIANSLSGVFQGLEE
ncbi:MAG: PqiC family protein [Methylococcales bacterium]